MAGDGRAGRAKPGHVPPVVRGTFATLSQVVDAVADEHGDVVALVQGDDRLTYAGWRRAADGLATVLRERGIGPGDVVALLLPSSIDYAVAYVAAMRLGAVVTGVNPRLGPVEMASIIDRTAPRVVIRDAELDRMPGLMARVPEVLDRSELAAAYEAEACTPVARGRADDPAAIVWTSGTTGAPKGVWYDHRALAAAVPLSGLLSRPFDRRLLPVPFAHAGFMSRVWDQMAYAMTVVLLPGEWTARSMLDVLVGERVTVGQGVPTQWAKLLELPELDDADLSALRVVGTGAARVPPELVDELTRRLGCPVIVRYALSEVPIATSTRVGDPPQVLAHSIGRPQPGVELQIVDDGGRPVPPGATGRLKLRSPFAMRGYWGDPQLTSTVVDDDGWILTSDLGTLDDAGNVVLAGRASEMYIRGGYNVYPLEVENVIDAHPAVDRVAVVGTPAPVIGEIGVAFVVVADGQTPPEPEEIRRWCHRRLADYKAPDRVVFLPELPLNSMLKPDRRALQALAEQVVGERPAPPAKAVG